MQSYCLSCKKPTDSIGLKKLIMTNKVVRQSSKCVNCVAKKSRFFKQKSNKKPVGTRLIQHLSYTSHYKTC